MRFLSDGIGELVLGELSNAVEARIAVAFFNPDTRMLNTLARLAKLTLIISEEFTVNNPYRLERLTQAKLRSIPPDSDDGKLHAKVLIIKRRNGSTFTLVGSANFTGAGLFSNQEACVVMESGDAADEKPVLEIKAWFESLLATAHEPDLEQAKLIFDARSRLRLVPRPPKEAAEGVRYWALKSTSGGTGEQHWGSFLAENVIAVGWTDIPVNPSKVSDAELRDAIRATYGDDDANGAAIRIRKFVDLKVDDIVVVCRGYAPNQEKDVHIYGLARVTGPFRDDRRTKWEWRFKHDAVIQVIDMFLPKETVVSALGKQSLMQTIHELEPAAFERLTAELKKRGAQLEV